MKYSRVFLCWAVLCTTGTALAQTSWKGTSSTAWSTAANWTAGVPTSSVDAIIGDANFTGSFQPTISGTTAVAKSLTLGTGTKASTLTVSKALTVSGNITIGTNGAISHTVSAAISLTGNWTNHGTYAGTRTGSTVTFAGTSQFISGTTATGFRKLTVSASSTTRLAGNISVTNTCTVNGTLDPGESPAYVISGAGALTVGNGGRLYVKATTFAGNYTLTGTKTLSPGSTVEYAASGNQTITNGLTYPTLRISGGGIKTLAGNLPSLNATNAANGNVYVDAGTLDLATSTANRATNVAGGSLNLAAGATLRIGGTNTLPANYTTHSFAASSTVEYYGTNQTVSPESYGNLILSSSGAATKTLPITNFVVAGAFSSATNAAGASVSFTAGAAITFNGTVTLGAGTTFNGGASTHSVGGNWTNHGTFTGANSTITIAAPNGILAGTGSTTFSNLSITRSGVTMNPNTSATITGNLTASTVATFTHTDGGTGTITMSGTSKSITGTGIAFNHLLLSGSISTVDSWTVAGNLTVSGSLSASAGIVTLAGTNKTLVNTGTAQFYGLSVPGIITTTNNFSLLSDLSVAGSLTATAGTATFNGTSTLSGTANLFNATLSGTKLQLGANSVLGVAGTFSLTTGTFDVTTSPPNTVSFNGSGAQSVNATTYHHLTLAGSGTKTAAGALTNNGDLTIGSGSTFAAGSASHLLAGNFVNGGTFTAGTSTVQLTGSANTYLQGATTFNALTLNKATTNTTVSLSNNVSVATLNLTNGLLLTLSNAVTITSTRTGGGLILGTITRTHTFSAGTAYAFEGTNSTVTFTSAGTVSSITMRVTSGAVSGFPFGGSVNRDYLVSVTGAAYLGTLRLHYNDSELNGNDESGMNLWRNTGSSWSSVGKSGSDTTNNWVEQNLLTDITGDWTFSDDNNVVRWNGSVSPAWDNATNWSVVQGAPSRPPGTNDIVQLGTVAFTSQPAISNAALAKNIVFGSAQAVTLTLNTGGSLAVSGNLNGSWTNSATHTLALNGQTLTVAGSLALSDGTNSHAINLTATNGTLNVTGSLTESGGANLTLAGTSALNLGGDFNYVSGTFTPGSSTVTYNGGAAQVVAGVTYNQLAFNKAGGTATVGASTTVNSNLTVTAGILSLGAPLTVTGDLALAAGTTVNGGSTTLSVGGNWTGTGAFVPGSGTVVLTGSSQQSIGSATFNNFTLNKAPGTAVLAGNLALNGDLNLSSGTLDLTTNTANRGAFGGTLTLAASTTLRVGATFPANFATRTLASDSTVIYYGTGAQTVSAETYGHLIITNASTKTMAGPVVVAGDLTIHSNATLASGNQLLELGGNWTNRGTFAYGTGTVKPTGTGKFLSGNTEVNTLTIAGSFTVAGTDLAIHGNLNILGALDLGSGSASLDGNLLNSGSLTSSGTATFTGTRVQTLQLLGALSTTSSGVINYNGTVAPVFFSTTPPQYATLNINNTAGLSPSIGWTVYGPCTIASNSAFYAGAGTHNFYHAFINHGTVTSSGTLNIAPATNTVVKLGGSFTSTGVVILGGTNQLTLTGNASTFNDLDLANTHAAGITANTNWTITGDLNIESGTILHAGTNTIHTVGGDDLVIDGVLLGERSLFVLTNATQIGGNGDPDFFNLTVAPTGNITVTGEFDIMGSLTNNGALDATGYTVDFEYESSGFIAGANAPTFDAIYVAKPGATLTLALNLPGVNSLTIDAGTLDTGTNTFTTIAAGSDLTVSTGATLKLGGTNSFPAFDVVTLDPASTVEYYGSGTQVIGAQNYGHLASSSSGARTLTNSGTIGIAGTFTPGGNTYTVTNSTVSFNGASAQVIPAFNFFHLASSGAGSRTLTNGGTIGIAGTFTPGANTYTVTNSTVSFNGAGATAAQTIPAFAYHHLTTAGSGTKTLGAASSVAGNLTLGSTLADAGFTLTVNGNAANSATHTGAGRVSLTGGTTSHTVTGGGAFQNLELADTNGLTLSATNLTVNGTLFLTAGTVTTDTNKVVLAPGATVSRTNGYVSGKLQKPFTTGTAFTNTFELGDTNGYAPVSLVLSNITTAGATLATVTTGDHASISNSGISASSSVNLWWNLTNTGGTFGTASATFNHATNHLDAGVNPLLFLVARRFGTNWFLPGLTNITLTNLTALGLTNFGDFIVGQSSASPTITNQPAGVRVNLGSNATFTVAASGATPLSYQWRLGGTNISGATNTTYTVSNSVDATAGNYSCAVSNVNGVTVSSNALLTLNHAPSLANPGTQAINELAAWNLTNSTTDTDGGTLTYSLTAAPSGATINTNTGVISWTPTEAQGPSTNTFTVQVADDGSPALTGSTTFSVIVNEVNSVPSLSVPGTQTLNELATLNVSVSGSDADVPANTLTYSLVSAPSGMSINASSGAITWTPTEAQGPSTNVISVAVTDNGSPNLSATNTFTVIVNEVNVAPVLTVPATQTFDELTTLSVSASATDADLPANTLTYALVSAPTGASINSSSGLITWTPTEAQGPSTNTITVKVTDNGTPNLSHTNSFTAIVTEANTAPVLNVPTNQIINELTTLTVTNTATDSDVPANTLTFSLVSAPTGMTIHTNTGVITWPPTEAQGPSTNDVIVAVTDNGSPNLTTTNGFTVTVREVNVAPVLTVPGTQTVDELTTLSVSASATDADIPVNTLTFSLVSAPTGASIDGSTGLITWTPTEAQGPSTNTISVRVTDDGSPALSHTNSFTVIVREANTAPVLTVPATQTVNELTTVSVSASATDLDLPANTLTYALVSAPTGVSINASSGLITWTPTEAQGPNSYTITVRVTDTGSPNLSDTNSFTVNVNEVNVAPVLTVPTNQIVNELGALNVSASATDADLPTNTLTFALVSAPTGMSIDAATGAITWTPTEAQGPSTNTIVVTVTDNGSPNLSTTNSFTVTVREVNAAPTLSVPATQTLDELTTLNVSVTGSDTDLPTNTLAYSLVSAPAGMSIGTNSGAITWTPSKSQGPSTNTVVARVTDNGSPALSGTNSFTVIVNDVNTAPTITVPATQTINEGSTLLVSASATDGDVPANDLTFSLAAAPGGASINATNGLITWTPTEAQGPSTNTISVTVTDDGSPALSDTKSFTVIVTEVNNAPILTVPADQTIDELATLTVTNTAVDPDIPANSLTYSLVSAPTNMVINATNGIITWTPTEAQGPSLNVISVRVTDDGSPFLSTTNSFLVTVREVNTAPVIAHVNDLYVDELATLVFTNQATDVDLPANTLTWSLMAAPGGMAINASTGVITWTPTERQGPATYSVIVVVNDNGSPALTATNRYTVVVGEVNSAPVLPDVGDQVVGVSSSLSLSLAATDTDSPVNKLTYSVVAGPEGLRISSTGLVTWTPTEAQRPSTNFVTISVVDGGNPPLSDTRSFNVRAIATDDTNAPTVIITSPVGSALRTSLATVTLSGTARDSRVVQQVRWSVNGGAYTATPGTTNWSASVPLEAGTNVLRVVAEDDSGNVSAPLSISVFRVVTSRLTLNYNGRGNTTPSLNGSLLEINRNYTLTAQPATDWILTNWGVGSNNVAFSTNLTITFTMTSNLVLNANFVSNPIVAVAGTYNGLFADNVNGTAFSSAGFLTLKLIKTGVFTGNAQVDGAQHAFTGTVGLDGHGTTTITRPGKLPLTLDLQLDLNDRSDELTGTVSSPDWTSALLADRVISSNTYKGAYTFVIPGSNFGGEPQGMGSGTATITAAGAGSIVVKLPEGTPGRQTVPVSKNGDWPLFIPVQYASSIITNVNPAVTNQLYHGLVIGWVHITNGAPRTFDGPLVWLKDPSGLGSTQYVAGYSIDTGLDGAGYTPPVSGTRVVPITTGVLTFTDGGLAAPLNFPLTLSTGNRVSFSSNTNKVTLTISPTTGVVSGTFLTPGSTALKSFNGVVLQDTGVMLGGFMGDTGGGTFSVQPQ